MNTVVHAIYDDAQLADQAVEQLRALGIEQQDIRLFTMHSSGARAHVGSFADSGPHTHTPERDHVGSFADSGPHTHTPERDHVGSFADSTQPHGTDALTRDVVRAGVSQAVAADYAARLMNGAAVVVAHVNGTQAEQATDILRMA